MNTYRGVLATPPVQHLLNSAVGFSTSSRGNITSRRAFEIDRVLDNRGIVPQVLVVLWLSGSVVRGIVLQSHDREPKNIRVLIQLVLVAAPRWMQQRTTTNSSKIPRFGPEFLWGWHEQDKPWQPMTSCRDATNPKMPPALEPHCTACV